MIKYMKKIISIFLLAVLILSCKKTSRELYNNDLNVRRIQHDGITREYTLYMPESYNGSTKVPLLFNFHGHGSKIKDLIIVADMRSVAEANNFILVYPQGSLLNGFSHWNACPPGGDNKSNADDLGFIESLIYGLLSDYNIDMERIYVAGYSNGGMMAYGLANYKSNLIAAVASVSGAMLDCTGPTNHPMPVVHLHGTADEVLSYTGGNAGGNEFSSAQSTLDYWINFNNTTTTPTINTDNSGGMTIEHYVYDQGDSSVSVEHYKYIGGNHVWFNTTYQGKSTGKLVWDFVSKYDINGLR